LSVSAASGRGEEAVGHERAGADAGELAGVGGGEDEPVDLVGMARERVI
jgi:hypothetical protein